MASEVEGLPLNKLGKKIYVVCLSFDVFITWSHQTLLESVKLLSFSMDLGHLYLYYYYASIYILFSDV
jgi:hypothetical protein